MNKHYCLDIYPIALLIDRVIEHSKTSSDPVDIAKEWFDTMVQTRLYWAKQDDVVAGDLLLQLMGYGDVDLEQDLPPNLQMIADLADSEMSDIFDQLMVRVLPHRTWNVVYVKFKNSTTVVLEIGGDYRVMEWARTNRVMLRRRGLWKAAMSSVK